jgi:hypothetical protein
MPTLTEKIDSREWTTGDRPSVTLHYLLAGVADDLILELLGGGYTQTFRRTAEDEATAAR